MKDQSLCLTAMVDRQTGNIVYNQKAFAVPTISDSQHSAQRPIDGSDSYWASAPGYKVINIFIGLLFISIFFFFFNIVYNINYFKF